MAWSEDAAIALLTKGFGGASTRSVRVGIGDDAAILRSASGALALSVDTSVEHVHFERSWLSLRDVGYRATQAALSDLAAVAARPLGILSALILPGDLSGADVAQIGRGQAEAAREHHTSVVGGNVARGGELSVTTTVVGAVDRPLLRTGARAGDQLWLVGSVGLARAGWQLLARGASGGRTAAARRCVAAWRRPRALVRRGIELAGCARAAIDLSDGLGADLRKFAKASGVRMVIDAPALTLTLDPQLIRAAEAAGWDALELALTGGEDYALLASGPKARRPAFAKVIGSVERGRGVVVRGAGRRRVPHGFEHHA